MSYKVGQACKGTNIKLSDFKDESDEFLSKTLVREKETDDDLFFGEMDDFIESDNNTPATPANKGIK
jgi:hypothetical protein